MFHEGPVLATVDKKVASTVEIPVAEPLLESRVREICLDVLSGLQYMHSNNIAHRDIKPDNLLVAGDGTVKICDFGSAFDYGVVEDQQSATPKLPQRIPGTPVFTAPELWGVSAGKIAKTQAFAADIWSLGASMFVLLFGRAPFRATRVDEIRHAICTQPLEFPRAPAVHESCTAPVAAYA